MKNVKIGDFSININPIKVASAIEFCPSLWVINSDGCPALVLEEHNTLFYTFDGCTMKPLTGLEDFVASINFNGSVAPDNVLKQLNSDIVGNNLPKEAQAYINALIYNRKMLNKYVQEGTETAKLMAELAMLPTHPMKDSAITRLSNLLPTANAREMVHGLKTLIVDIKYCCIIILTKVSLSVSNLSIFFRFKSK